MSELTETTQEKMDALQAKANEICNGILPKLWIEYFEGDQQFELRLVLSEGRPSGVTLTRRYAIERQVDDIINDFNAAVAGTSNVLIELVGKITVLAFQAATALDDMDRRRRMQQILNLCSGAGFEVKSVNSTPVDGGGKLH